MLKRVGGYLAHREDRGAPAASRKLQADGFAILRGVFSPGQVATLKREINRVFRDYPADGRAGQHRSQAEDACYRYEMLNRSAACQRAVANPDILATIEPLLGEDCHVIANTAWRNPPDHESEHGGRAWHIDAGPHIPLPKGRYWPPSLPHPVFAIGTHIYLQDCGARDGPTGVIPGSHLSGRTPPPDRLMDDKLKFRRKGVEPLLAAAGDVGFFVSDVWHRRMPSGPGARGRFFLQVHYGRRDIAQRLRTTEETHQLSEAALGRVRNNRQKTVAGLHPPGFYDG